MVSLVKLRLPCPLVAMDPSPMPKDDLTLKSLPKHVAKLPRRSCRLHLDIFEMPGTAIAAMFTIQTSKCIWLNYALS